MLLKEVSFLVYLRTNELAPGMCMAREITFFDASAGAVVTLKAGTKLTDMNITQMRMSRVVAGAFIDSRNSETRVISSINSEIKENATILQTILWTAARASLRAT